MLISTVPLFFGGRVFHCFPDITMVSRQANSTAVLFYSFFSRNR